MNAELPGELVEQLLTSEDPSRPVQARFSIATEGGAAAPGRATGPFFAAGDDATYAVDLATSGPMSRSPRRPPAEPSAGEGPGSPSLGLVVLATLAVLVTAADTYVVVLALPDILTGVGVGLDELQRATPIIGGFLLGYTATLPLLGRLADLRGRVPVLVGCLLVFALGSLLTATADALGPAVLGRGLQGIGAGGLVPATLALVADRWPPERRSMPLGVVGAVQEAGAVLGPLAGAAVLARRRLAGHLLAQSAARARPGGRRRGVGAASGVPTGRPRAGRPGRPRPRAAAGRARLRSPRTSPRAALGAAGRRLAAVRPRCVVVAVLAGAAPWRAACATPAGAVLPLRGLRRLAARGRRARLGLVVVVPRRLVWAFAAADPATEVVAARRGAAAAGGWSPAAAFVVHERRAAAPVLPLRALRPVGAWGALLVNLLVGAALVAALVDVPLFARATTTPGDQLGAALVLLRLLVAVPVGAVAGGWLCRVVPPRVVAGAGMALAAVAFVVMTGWGERVAGRRRGRPSSWRPPVWASAWRSPRSTPCCSP